MKLFQMAVVSKPSKKEIEDGVKPELLFWTEKPILAVDANAAILKALRGTDIDLDKAEVHVLPFAE